MQLTSLSAISPIDGRYAGKSFPLRSLCSEYGLIRYRLRVELRWLLELTEHPEIKELAPLNIDARNRLLQLHDQFSIEDAQRVKSIEANTNHDVKALEYYTRELLQRDVDLSPLVPFVHFGCTSEDINNLAYAMMLRDIRDEHLTPVLHDLTDNLEQMAVRYADAAMLAHTHGQPASPTSMGKEMRIFANRLRQQTERLNQVVIAGKFNGAVGNYNAHCISYPEVDWLSLSANFIQQLGLTPNLHTTQIEPHDWMAEYFHALVRINAILMDLSRDCWGYISLGYLAQSTVSSEVGSSTMPHKINPIDFENAEGNLGLANSLLEHLATKLMMSRWQRDLTDSTVLRNIGSVVAYCLIGYQSLLKGLQRITPNELCMASDLDQHWEVLAEAAQTVMRRYGQVQAYEQLKALTRGQKLTSSQWGSFIQTLDLPEEARNLLLALTPADYTGLAATLARLK